MRFGRDISDGRSPKVIKMFGLEKRFDLQLVSRLGPVIVTSLLLFGCSTAPTNSSQETEGDQGSDVASEQNDLDSVSSGEAIDESEGSDVASEQNDLDSVSSGEGIE